MTCLGREAHVPADCSGPARAPGQGHGAVGGGSAARTSASGHTKVLGIWVGGDR
jgi:hypothetical protein